MALSGTLQNFAGGVMILLFKPFKVGDVIEIRFGNKNTKVEVLSIEETYKKDEAKELYRYL